MNNDNNNNNNINNNEDDENKKSKLSSFFSLDKFPTHIMGPSFINKEMPLGYFFLTAGCLSALGFGVGILVGLRKTGGVRQTIRTAPPGVVGAAVKALAGGTAICAGLTTGLVYLLKYAYNIETVKDFGDMMKRGGGIKKSESTSNNDNQQPQDLSSFSEEDKAIHRENMNALKALKFIPYNEDDIKQLNQNNNNNEKDQNNLIKIDENIKNNNNNNNNKN